MFVEMETDENGCITWDSLEGMDIEDVQDLIDILEDAVRVDNKNLEVLKKKRSALGLVLFDTKYKEQKSFETERHTFTRQPKSATSGLLIQKNHPVIWKELTTKFAQLLNPSKKDVEEYLKAKGASKEQVEKILGDITYEMQPAVTARKR